MSDYIVGWDIGGAHLKVAVLNRKAEIVRVLQQPCPLWKGLGYLTQAVDLIKAELPDTNLTHVLTMTGELVDLFVSRDAGVKQIIAAMQTSLPGSDLHVYAGKLGFLNATELKSHHYAAVASANWLASASLVAQRVPNALFVDIGSTTTDILLCTNQQVQALGLTDYARLQSQELVYTGIIRTPVMAVTQAAFFQGQPVQLMAEYFATMADVYRVTRELNENHDQTETADGGKKNILGSARRLSRLIGYEFKSSDIHLWQQFAVQIKQQQKYQIQQACLRQLSRLHKQDSVFIGAGIGRFLAAEIAQQLNYPYQDFNQLCITQTSDSAMDAADCAPAVAIAYLLIQ